jgi:hypothetical protein
LRNVAAISVCDGNYIVALGVGATHSPYLSIYVNAERAPRGRYVDEMVASTSNAAAAVGGGKLACGMWE